MYLPILHLCRVELQVAKKIATCKSGHLKIILLFFALVFIGDICTIFMLNNYNYSMYRQPCQL